MSYILDALRRADAERERGSVPGLHAQPVGLGDMDADSRRPKPFAWWSAGIVLAFLLLAAIGWWVLGGSEPPRASVSAGSVAPAPASPLPAAPIPAAPIVAAPPPAALPAGTVAATVLPPAAAPVPVPRVAHKPPPKAASAAPAKTPSAAAASKPSAGATSASSPPPVDPRVYQLGELPDDVRRELPTLAIGGAMYSQNPANRMLIVNGQTFHEGDKLAPNLTLEQIKLKSAVLEYKGYRYGITY